MAKLNIRYKGLQDISDKMVPLYVIRGEGDRAGHIKTEYVGPNKDPHFARCFWDIDPNGRRIRLTDAVVHPTYAERGWRLLQDEYEKEGRLHDWGQFQEFQRACRAGKLKLSDAEKNDMRNDPCPGFPTDMLPKYCQDISDREKGPGSKWRPVRESEVKDEDKEELAEELPADSGSGDRGAEKAKRSRRRSKPVGSGVAKSEADPESDAI